MVLLAARELVKDYADRRVLEAIELTVEPGTITAVCGENGAGKSTLLRLLALLEHPDQGQVFFQDRPLRSHGDWFAARKRITMVEQNPYAFHGSVFRNVAYGLTVRGLRAEARAIKVAEALTGVGLSGFERRNARTLSGGEVQRLALARAMVCAPAVLILDEPTAHVDAARVAEVEFLVRRLRDEKGVAIILATHSNDQACRLADRVLRLEAGRLDESAGRTLSGRLAREPSGLTVALTDPWPDGKEALLAGLDRDGDSVILRLEGKAPRIRVPRPEVLVAKPLPGETVTLKPARN